MELDKLHLAMKKILFLILAFYVYSISDRSDYLHGGTLQGYDARVDERNEKHRIMENLATGRNHTLFAKIAEQGWIL